MKCPRCQTPLEENPLAGVPGCRGCGGWWLTHEQAEALTRPEAAAPSWDRRRSERLRALESDEIRCPACEAPLSRRRYPGSLLDLDLCACGVWLDAGELAKIQRLRQAKLQEYLRLPGGEEQASQRAELERMAARRAFQGG